MVALHETQDLAVGEHGAVVADDPKLKVNVHGRRLAGLFRKLQGIQPPNYLPSRPSYKPPTVSGALQSRRDKKAAKRLLRKLLKRQGRAPRVMITELTWSQSKTA
jgi:hypothetical protein